jgi:DNA-binding NarL/FixJ family response regulator
MIRLLICEDDPRYRRLLTKVLTACADVSLVGAATSGEEACAMVATERPGLLLLDLELPGISGMEVIRALRPGASGLEILVLTSFADETKVYEAIQHGAAGYIVKGIAPRQLDEAIHEVMAGGTVIDARLGRRFWNYFASVQGQEAASCDLTAEELEVLTLVGRGLSNPEAARTLGATRRTIKAHLENVYRKLGVANRVEATVKALQAGLIRL